MKILFLSSLQKGSLGFSFMNSMTQLGHEVIFNDYRGRIEKAGITSFNEFLQKAQNGMDLVFVLKGDNIDPNLITKCPKILYYPDSVERYKDDISNLNKYDKVFIGDPNLPEGATYVPVGVDPMFTPMCTKWNPVKRIIFPATGREERVEWVRRLHKKYGLEVYGNSWYKGTPYWKGEPLYHNDLTNICSQSAWMFNLVSGSGINSRIFETLYIGGAVLISQYNEEIARTFEDKKHLYLFHDIEELYDILDNPQSFEKMCQIREAGQKEVLEKHLMIHRMKFMMEECEKL